MYAMRMRSRVQLLLFAGFVLFSAGGLTVAADGQQVKSAPRTAQTVGFPIVRITSSGGGDGALAGGVGFYVRRNLVATAYPVVKDGLSFKARLGEGQPFAATLIGVDQKRTLALLSVANEAPNPLSVRYEQDPKSGDDVFVGAPAGKEIIKGRLADDLRSLKLEQPLNASSVGSPVLNKSGEVIGVLGISSGADIAFIPISSLTDVGEVVSAGSSKDVEARKAADEVEAQVDLIGQNQAGPLVAGRQRSSGPPPGTIRFRRIEGPEHDTAAPEAPQTPGVIRKTPNALLASAIRQAEPLYPHRAKAQNLSGIVFVQVTVDWRGYVVDARALNGLPMLRPAAVAAAMAHLFSPTIVDGQAVEVTGTLRFLFRPQGPGEPAVTRTAPIVPEDRN